MKKIFYIIVTLVMALPLSVNAAVYEIDPAHTDFGFSVQHMVIAKVKGTFQKFEGKLDIDDNHKITHAESVISAESIYTKIEKRDNHLRSPDFFDVAKYPTIAFKSTSVTYNGTNKFTMKGLITIREVTKEITLAGESLGPIKDPWGQTRMGFNASGQLNRKDFGLTWNKVLESGGLVVGDTINLIIEGESILKQ